MIARSHCRHIEIASIAHAAAGAYEEGDAEVALEEFELLGDGGLADGQALGRGGDAAGLGDGVEDGEVVEVEIHNQ